MAATPDGFLLGNGNRGGLTINLQPDMISSSCAHMSLCDTRRVRNSQHILQAQQENYHRPMLSLVSLPSSRNLCHAGNIPKFEPL